MIFWFLTNYVFAYPLLWHQTCPESLTFTTKGFFKIHINTIVQGVVSTSMPSFKILKLGMMQMCCCKVAITIVEYNSSMFWRWETQTHTLILCEFTMLASCSACNGFTRPCQASLIVCLMLLLPPSLEEVKFTRPRSQPFTSWAYCRRL